MAGCRTVESFGIFRSDPVARVKHVAIEVAGFASVQPFSVSLQGGTVRELIERRDSWPIDSFHWVGSMRSMPPWLRVGEFSFHGAFPGALAEAVEISATLLDGGVGASPPGGRVLGVEIAGRGRLGVIDDSVRRAQRCDCAAR